ncbi:MAG: hypothetical protein IKH75_11775 [Ruminococcus sp.]|nr:hypothetical protein [Ruminococcus sp.]
MILEFKSPRSTCGHREYLRIDTAARTYRTEPHFIAEGIEISRKEIRDLKDKAIQDGYKAI